MQLINKNQSRDQLETFPPKWQPVK